MSSTYVIKAFGLNDKVLNCQTGDCFSTGYIPSSVVAKSKNFIVGGLRAISDRSCSGFSQYPDQIVDESYSLVEKIPVSTLWYALVNHKDNNKLLRRVEHTNFGSSYESKRLILKKENFSLYIHDLIAKQLEELFEDYKRKFKDENKLKKEESKIVIPIPNELTEYVQEDLLKSLKKDRKDIIFIWREVAALMQYLHLNYQDCEKYINKKIKVFYAGADGFEFAIFKLEKRNDFIVPIRVRPNKNTTKISGFNFLCNCVENFIQNKFEKAPADLNLSRLVWQLLMLRPETVYNILTFENKPSFIPIIYPNFRLASNIYISDENIKKSLDKNLFSTLFNELSSNGKKYNPNRSNVDMESIVDLLKQDLDNCKALLFCGDLVGPRFLSSVKDFLPKNVKLLYEEEDLILEGCKLYAQRLEKGAPTYFDTLPPLEIAYYDDRENDFCWFPLVTESLIAGGQTYELEEPCEMFSLKKGAKELEFYLKTESLDAESGIHSSKRIFDKAAKKNIPLLIYVQMKAAFGLAKITLKNNCNFGPKRGYIFDYSEMKKGELPYISLSFPRDGQMLDGATLSYTEKININSRMDKFCSALDLFLSLNGKKIDEISLLELEPVMNDALRQSKNKIFYDINLRCKDDDIKEKLNLAAKKTELLLNQYFPPKGNDYKKAQKIMEESVQGQFFYNFLSLSERKQKEEIASIVNFIDWFVSNKILIRSTSFFKFTPKVVTDLFRILLSEPFIEYAKPNLYFEAACHCLFTSKEDICLIYNFFNKAKDRNKIYYFNGLFWILNYIKDAKKYLDKETALNMVEASVQAFKDSKENKNFKNKFIAAINLFLMALKYRYTDKSFLSTDDYSSTRNRLLRSISDSINFYRLNDPSNRYYEILVDIEQQVIEFINKRGSQNIFMKLRSLEDPD